MKRKFYRNILIVLFIFFIYISFMGMINKSNASDIINTWDISADDEESNVTATLYDDGKFVISGTGAINNYTRSEDREYFENISEIKNVLVEQGVTNIGKLAFDRCTNLEKILLPDGIKKIGAGAFYKCSKLGEIKLPDSIKELGSESFAYCSKISKINIPYGVRKIEQNCFYKCSNLKKVEIPNTVKEIKYNTFLECKNLEKIEVPYGVTTIGEKAFYGCSKLKKIDISSTVKNLGKSVFEKCTSIEEINMPQDLTNVGEKAFWNAQIKLNTVNDEEYKSVQIPDYIKNQITTNPNNCELINCELDNDNSIKVNTRLSGNKIIKINEGILKGLNIIVSINSTDGHIPEFYGTTNITIRVGDELDLKNSYYRIFAKDYEEGNISRNIEIVSNNVNTSEAGNYEIIYEITDNNNNIIRAIVPVQVIENGDRKIQRTLYTLPDASILNSTSFTRGNNHDIQDLGIYLPANKAFRIKQLNNKENSVYVHSFNNDSAKENSYEANIHRMSQEIADEHNAGIVEYTAEELEQVPADKIDSNTGTVKKSEMYSVKNIDSRVQIGKDDYSEVSNRFTIQYKANYKENQEYQELQQYWDTKDSEAKSSFDSVPVIKTLYGVEEKPILEIILNDDIKPLDYFTYGDNTDEFINEWEESQNSFAILEGNRTTFLVPIKDLNNLCKSKKEQNILDSNGVNKYRHDDFSNIDQILNYYDNLVEIYDKWIGLSDNPSNIYDLNIKSKFFIKANVHGAGGLAYTVSNYTYCTDDDIDTYLHRSGDGWAPFHEFGHGYQGFLKHKELYLTEISNNFFAYYIQKKLTPSEDWLDDNVGDQDKLEEMMNAIKNDTVLEENQKSFLEYYPKDAAGEENKTRVNIFKSRLFIYINLLNKLDFEKVLPYTYSYCRALYEEEKDNNMTATDIIAKCFSEASGYNVIPYLESCKLTISEQIKKEIYDKDYPIVYYLQDIVGDSAENIKNTLQLKYIFYDEEAEEIYLPYLYSTISNNDIDNYNLKGSVKLKLDSEEISKLYGKTILIKSGNNVIRTVNINSNELNLNDMPAGIYEIELEENDYIFDTRSIIISKNSNEEEDLSSTPIYIDNIEIEEYPNCRNYIKGSDLDLSGIKVKAIYNNGTYEYIDDYTVEGYDKNTIGEQEVTVRYEEKEAKFRVMVNEIAVTGVEISGSESVLVGEEIELTCIVEPDNAEDKGVTWTSSNTDIATVDDEGKVRGISNGTVTITVTTDDGGYTATKTITVTTAVTGIDIDNTTLNLVKGRTGNITVMVKPDTASNKNITVVNSDESVAIVNIVPETNKIIVTGIKEGETTITVSTKDGEYETECHVIVHNNVTKIEVSKNPDTTTYIKGEELDLRGIEITATYEDGSKELIELPEESFTGFNSNTIGEQIITVRYNGKETNFRVYVKNNLEEIQVKCNPNKTVYLKGESFEKEGMIVEAIYEDGSRREITDYEIIDGEDLEIGQNTVYIAYSENGITKTTNLRIIVNEKLIVQSEEYSFVDANDEKYLEDIKPETTIKEFKKKILTNGDIKIYKDNIEITDENNLVTTGMKIIIRLYDEELRYTAVVIGDLMGDGKMDTVDLLKLSRYNAKIDLNLENEYLRAADVYKDGECGNIVDLLKMSRILAKIENL